MTDAQDRALLEGAVADFTHAREVAETDPIKSLAISAAVAGRAVATALLSELPEVAPEA